jgi:hypothetical protein
VVDTVQQVTLETVVQVDQVVARQEDLLVLGVVVPADKEIQALVQPVVVVDQHHIMEAEEAEQVQQLPIMH